MITQDTISSVLQKMGIDLGNKRWVYEMARLWITAAQLEEIDTYFRNYYNPN